MGMDYDEAKDETLALLSALVDKASALVRTAFLGHGCTTRVKTADYTAQVLVFDFPETQPTSDLVDVIGAEVRSLWPDAPAMTAIFFKASSLNGSLILDLNRPSGVKALAEAGNVQALFALTGGNVLPTLHYVLDGPLPTRIDRVPGMMTVHERSV